jgi:hypothetical protein
VRDGLKETGEAMIRIRGRARCEEGPSKTKDSEFDDPVGGCWREGIAVRVGVGGLSLHSLKRRGGGGGRGVGMMESSKL